MKKIKEIQQRIFEAISRNDLEEALLILKKNLNKESQIIDDVTMIERRFSSIKKDEKNGTKEDNYIDTYKSKLTQSIITIVSNLSEKDLIPIDRIKFQYAANKQNSLTDVILVSGKNFNTVSNKNKRYKNYILILTTMLSLSLMVTIFVYCKCKKQIINIEKGNYLRPLHDSLIHGKNKLFDLVIEKSTLLEKEYLIELRLKSNSLEDELNISQKEIQNLSLEIQKYNSKIVKLEENIKTEKSLNHTNTTKYSKLEKQLEDAQNQKEHNILKLGQLLEKVKLLKSKISDLEKNISYLQRKIYVMQDSILDMKDTLYLQHTRNINEYNNLAVEYNKIAPKNLQKKLKKKD